MDKKTDSLPSSAEALRYPWENHPGHDQVVEVAPGVLWARLKLRGDAVMDYALRDLSADERTQLLSLLTRIRDSLTTP